MPAPDPPYRVSHLQSVVQPWHYFSVFALIVVWVIVTTVMLVHLPTAFYLTAHWFIFVPFLPAKFKIDQLQMKISSNKTVSEKLQTRVDLLCYKEHGQNTNIDDFFLLTSTTTHAPQFTALVWGRGSTPIGSLQSNYQTVLLQHSSVRLSPAVRPKRKCICSWLGAAVHYCESLIQQTLHCYTVFSLIWKLSCLVFLAIVCRFVKL